MTQLVRRYEVPLFRFLLRMVGDAQLAEDLFQETVLRLHRSRERVDPGQPLKPYLYRIAINLARDAMSRRARQNPPHSLEPGTAPASNAPDPARQGEQHELHDRVRQAISALPSTEREVVLLRLFEGLSFPQIARASDIPESTAKSRLRYALRRLRPVLEEYLR